MPKNKQKLLQYIDHGETLKRRYQKANLKGQHNCKIKEIDEKLTKAKKALLYL